MSYSLALFSLEGIRPVMHKQAKAAARRGDPLRIFGCEDSNNSLALFSKNVVWFAVNGLYEKALLAAWVNQKWVPPGFHENMREALLSADRKKLMKHSDPLLHGDEFTVYRGVQNGVPRGISWTLDPDVARRFASRSGLGGTVYKTVVKRSDVYAYVSDVAGRQGEKEVLLVLPDHHPIEVFEKVEARP
ncbi:MAG TPA: hypothetical protein VE994_09860 [Terriglobales bacterium]|nr:hypothetical protein [Terriglobales bacterium]